MAAVIVLDDGTTIVPYNSSRTGPQMDVAMDGGDSVGNLNNLTTTEKSSVVGAINEINSEVTNAKEDLSELIEEKTTLIYDSHDPQYIVENSKRLNPSGIVETVSNVNLFVSESLNVTDYSKVIITARANYSNGLYAFYDVSGACIFVEKSSGGETSTQITDKVVNVPANAVTLRIAMSYNISPFMACKSVEISPKGFNTLETELDALKTSFDDLESKLDGITDTETYDITINFVPTWYSGYINKSGSSGTGNYVHTEKIAVKEGDIIWGTSDTTGGVINHRFLCAYNGDSAISSAGGEYVNAYTVPQGIDGVVFTYGSTSTTQNITYHIKKNVSEIVIKPVNVNDTLFGKKWAVLGDSFSYGGYSPMNLFENGRYAGSRKVYPYYIGNRTHINIVDFTLGGRTLAYPADGSFSNSLTNPNAECYYQNIPEDVDYITIYIGINDSHHASGTSGPDGEDVTGVIPIGTINDTTTATFGGAWNVVLMWLIENRPNAHIGIIVSNGVDSVDYRDLTIAIAKNMELLILI